MWRLKAEPQAVPTRALQEYVDATAGTGKNDAEMQAEKMEFNSVVKFYGAEARREQVDSWATKSPKNRVLSHFLDRKGQ